MSFPVVFEPNYTRHPKWTVLSDAAFRFAHKVIDWCFTNETDIIPDATAADLMGSGPRARKLGLELENCGLHFNKSAGILVRIDQGWRVHGFWERVDASLLRAEHREPAEPQEPRSRSEAGRLGGLRSAAKRRSESGSAQPKQRQSSPEATSGASGVASTFASSGPPKQNDFASGSASKQNQFASAFASGGDPGGTIGGSPSGSGSGASESEKIRNKPDKLDMGGEKSAPEAPPKQTQASPEAKPDSPEANPEANAVAGPKQNDENDGENAEEGKGRPWKPKQNDPYRVDSLYVFDRWKEDTGHHRAVLDKKRYNRIKARLIEGFSRDQLIEAIRNRRNHVFLMGQNDTGMVYDGLQVLLRDADQVEKLLRLKEPLTGTRQRGGPPQPAGHGVDPFAKATSR